MAEKFQIDHVGTIKKKGKTVAIEIHPEYEEGLVGLDQFSHILVCFWFHKNDTREQRKTLLVHPRGNKENPLTGVFATRSPQRPNPFGISVCKILSIVENTIYIDKIDAFNGSPAIDIKPYIPKIDSIPLLSDVITPCWVKK